MKIILSAAELAKFAESVTPVTSFVDQEKNKDLQEGEQPSNLTGQMVSDMMKLVGNKFVKEDGPAKVSMVEGNLEIDIKEEFTTEFTEMYFKHVVATLSPMLALIKVLSAQQEDIEAFQAKWFPRPDYNLGATNVFL